MTWPVPKFDYGQSVVVIPNDRVHARITDLHMFGQQCSVEYSVRYFHNGEAKTVRVFEDELERLEDHKLREIIHVQR